MQCLFLTHQKRVNFERFANHMYMNSSIYLTQINEIHFVAVTCDSFKTSEKVASFFFAFMLLLLIKVYSLKN